MGRVQKDERDGEPAMHVGHKMGSADFAQLTSWVVKLRTNNSGASHNNGEG